MFSSDDQNVCNVRTIVAALRMSLTLIAVLALIGFIGCVPVGNSSDNVGASNNDGTSNNGGTTNNGGGTNNGGTTNNGTSNSSGATCEDYICAEENCELLCENAEQCGHFETQEQVDDCYWQCGVLDDESGLIPGTEADCERAQATYMTCLSNLECDALGEYLAAEGANYPCELEEEAALRACPWLPASVNVEFLGVVVGPAKSDRTEWDGVGSLDEQKYGEYINMIIEVDAGQLAVALVNEFQSLVSKPDPIVQTSVDTGSGWSGYQTVGPARDTFQAQFRLEYRDQPLDESLRFAVAVVDSDLENNDDVGIAILTYDDVLAALAADGSIWIKVADQTNNQLALVQWSITAAQ